MVTRYKIGFISRLSYGPTKEQQRDFLIDEGVDPNNIFEAPDDTPLDAANACREGQSNILVVALEQVLGRYYGEVFAMLDERGADLKSIATNTVYPCTNGKTFGAFKAIMDKSQTAAARAAPKRKRTGPRIKMTDKQVAKAEMMLANGKSMREVADHFGVAPNYLSRSKGITVESARAKYDKK